jgi:hypothetical protein
VPRRNSVSPFSNVVPADFVADFVGRKRELDEIRDAFAKGFRGVVIVGQPGVGKSTLARLFESRAENIFPGGISMVEASSVEYVKHHFDSGQYAQSLLAHTNTRSGQSDSLLIVDNADALGERGTAVIEDIASRHPRSKIILTSRRVLSLFRYFRIIKLHSFSKEEFDALFALRSAID